jgi:hypothetical protein
MTRKIEYILIIITICFGFTLNTSNAQVKGESPSVLKDTVFIFDSPRPLLTTIDIEKKLVGAFGFDLLFSGHGFGGGLFYDRRVSENLTLFASFHISGARNSDEFDTEWDPVKRTYVVPDKINRLFMFPLYVGANYYVFTEELTKSLMPYISVGLGPTFILSTPYEREFFSSFSYASAYTRFGSYFGIGADVGGAGESVMSVNIKYYYIPFGGEGLESIKKLPITDFGGIFLTLSVGMRF